MKSFRTMTDSIKIIDQFSQHLPLFRSWKVFHGYFVSNMNGKFYVIEPRLVLASGWKICFKLVIGAGDSPASQCIDCDHRSPVEISYNKVRPRTLTVEKAWAVFLQVVRKSRNNIFSFFQEPEFMLLQSGSSIDDTRRTALQCGPWASCCTTWCAGTSPSRQTLRSWWGFQTGATPPPCLRA